MELIVGEENKFIFCPMCAGKLSVRKIDGRLRPVCLSCGWIHYLNPPPVVCAVCYTKGNILLIKRAVEPKKGYWSLPGGFMELCESPQQACLRELAEETGIKSVSNMKLISAEYQESRRYGSVIVIGYSLEAKEPSCLHPSDDAEEVKWFPLFSRPKMPFHSFEQILIKWEKNINFENL